jgi:hypothetical protein
MPAPVAQWIEQQVSTLSVGGSSPSGRAFVMIDSAGCDQLVWQAPRHSCAGTCASLGYAGDPSPVGRVPHTAVRSTLTHVPLSAFRTRVMSISPSVLPSGGPIVGEITAHPSLQSSPLICRSDWSFPIAATTASFTAAASHAGWAAAEDAELAEPDEHPANRSEAPVTMAMVTSIERTTTSRQDARTRDCARLCSPGVTRPAVGHDRTPGLPDARLATQPNSDPSHACLSRRSCSAHTTRTTAAVSGRGRSSSSPCRLRPRRTPCPPRSAHAPKCT